jgi:hypothetical protein
MERYVPEQMTPQFRSTPWAERANLEVCAVVGIEVASAAKDFPQEGLTHSPP